MTAKMAEYESSFRAKYPKIKFEIICLEGEDGIAKIKTKEIDILIGHIQIDSDTDIIKFTFGEAETIFAAEKGFAKEFGIEPVISKEKFNALPLIGVREFVPWKTPDILVDRMESTFQRVMRKMGIGWFLDDFLDKNHPHDPYVKFQVEGMTPVKYDYYCAYSPKFTSRTALEFVKHVESSFK
jgi:hypothetical protein